MHLYLGLDGVNVDQRVLTSFYVFIYVFNIGEAHLAIGEVLDFASFRHVVKTYVQPHRMQKI
jgi:hypothetical protein